MTPKRLRISGWLQLRALMWHSANLASCSSLVIALFETGLKGCGCCTLPPPKDILRHCMRLLLVMSTVTVLLQTWPKPFAGTGAPKQRATLTLQASYRSWARELTQQQRLPPSPPCNKMVLG